MRVRHGLVDMLMLVAFREVKPNTQPHEGPGHEELDGDRFSKSQNGNGRTQKWSGREIRSGARRAEMPKRDNEQREAYAVAKKTDDARKQSIRRAGQRSTGPKPKRNTDGSGNQALELDNLQRIGKRYLSRQIVVEAPHDAGADYGNGTDSTRQRRGAGPRKNDGAGHEADHAKRDPA